MSNNSTILLVDDDPEIVRAASLRLMAAGYHTLTAHNGQAGVAAAVVNRPKAVVLDVRMPVQDGFAALAELKRRRDTRDIPVIMLSASIRDQQSALDAGARFFLRKPYRGDALVQAVNSALAADRPGMCSEQHACSSPEAASGSLTTDSSATTPASDNLRSSNHRLLDLVLQMLNADSEPGKGSAEQGQPARQPTVRPWVLCVDDDSKYSNMLRLQMELQGIDIVRAADGRAGMRAAIHKRADAILLDFQLPNGVGDEILRRLKKNAVTKNIPVIVLTARKDRGLAERMVGLGAARFMSKPPDFEELVKELRRQIVVTQARCGEAGQDSRSTPAGPGAAPNK